MESEKIILPNAPLSCRPLGFRFSVDGYSDIVKNIVEKTIKKEENREEEEIKTQ